MFLKKNWPLFEKARKTNSYQLFSWRNIFLPEVTTPTWKCCLAWRRMISQMPERRTLSCHRDSRSARNRSEHARTWPKDYSLEKQRRHLISSFTIVPKNVIRVLHSQVSLRRRVFFGLVLISPHFRLKCFIKILWKSVNGLVDRFLCWLMDFSCHYLKIFETEQSGIWECWEISGRRPRRR